MDQTLVQNGLRMDKAITVLLADDHALFRQGIRHLLSDSLKDATDRKSTRLNSSH